VKGSDADGFTFQGSSGSIIGCSTRGLGVPGTSARFGIFVQPLTTYPLNIVVSNNRVEGKVTSSERGRGICVSATSGYENYDSIVITGNVIVDTYNGIEVSTPTANKIEGLVIANNVIRRGALSTACILVTKAQYGAVTGNVVSMASSSRSGIKLDTCADMTVTGNVCRVNGSTNCIGINLDSCADVEVLGNRVITAAGAGCVGIDLDASCSNCVVMGNNARSSTTPLALNGVTSHITTTADNGGAYNRT
jgi:parallel beta-helix repeat protein